MTYLDPAKFALSPCLPAGRGAPWLLLWTERLLGTLLGGELVSIGKCLLVSPGFWDYRGKSTNTLVWDVPFRNALNF